MTIIRDTLTSPGSTYRQNQASTSTAPRQSSSPARPASPARSRPPSSTATETFSKEGDQVSGSRLFGRLMSSEGPIKAVCTQATTASVGGGLEQSVYPFIERANTNRGDTSNRLSHELRQELLHIFVNDPSRRNVNIAHQFRVPKSTISRLRQQFNETGNIDRGDRGNRLTDQQRQEILHIFVNDPSRRDVDIAQQLRVSHSTVSRLKLQFKKDRNVNPRKLTNRLTDQQRQEILHIFINAPSRRDVNIAHQFQVAQPTISRLRQQFNETGNIDPGNPGKHLTDEQRQEILHAFTNNPNLNDTKIAQQFLVAHSTISRLRKQFNETGNINRMEPTNRLPHEQEQQEQEIGHVASSSRAASGKGSKRPASTSADLEHLHLQKRARIDSAPLYAGQTSDRTSSTGIRIFGVQLYPENAAQHGQRNKQT